MAKNLPLILFAAAAAALSAAGLLTRLSWSNLDLIILDTLLRPFVSVTVLTLAVASVFYFISKRAFALVPAGIFLLFTYGSVADLFAGHTYNRALAAAVLIALIGIVAYLTRNADPVRIAQAVCALFFFMAAPFSLPLIGLAFQKAPPQPAPEFASYVDSLERTAAERQSSLPDVIYIIPDRYGSARTVQSIYGLDNSTFYEQLRTRGFRFAADASANYPTTAHSVASTANSGYLNTFADTYGRETGRMQPLYSGFENSLAQRAMRRLGYRFINAGSWWDASRFNDNADENFGMDISQGLNKATMSEIEFILWRGTPLREFVGFLTSDSAIPECHRIKRKLEWLAASGNKSQPVFILAHMTIPHTPIVASRDGECLAEVIDYPRLGVTWTQFKAAYAEYLRYFNKAILGVFDRQLQRRAASGRKLMFIIQSDEGPYPEITRLQENQQSYADLPEPQMRNKLGILNAMYLAGGQSVSPNELRTPINNWRIILEQITDKPAGRQEHKVHIYKDHKNIHDYTDVTEQFLK